MTKRPHGVFGLGLACLQAAATGRTEHAPTSADYPDTVVRRVFFQAGGGHGWRVSALETPRGKPARWRIVVITGAPSWSEYWAPALAALPADREMIVVDRPGFAGSEPFDCVPDIRVQAEALAPLLDAKPGQRILLVGQSYGAPIATLMARARPRRVAGVVLLSSYLGVAGPTTRWLILDGSKDEQKFKDFLRRHELPTNVWYKAYPGLTAFDLKRNTLIREGIEKESLTDAELAQWVALF